jgi:transcription initiation factor IIE alpha subunit
MAGIGYDRTVSHDTRIFHQCPKCGEMVESDPCGASVVCERCGATLVEDAYGRFFQINTLDRQVDYRDRPITAKADLEKIR